MKNLLVIVLLFSLSSSARMLAADADVCRRLLASQLQTYPDTNGDAVYFGDAEKAYRDCRGAGLPVDIRVGVLVKYGTAKYVRGYTQAAVEAYCEAIAILDRTPGDQSMMLIDVLDSTVAAETSLRLRSEAIGHAQRSLSLRQSRFGEDSPEAIKGMVALGAVYATFGDWGKWESLLRTAVRIAEKACAPECDALAEAYSGMAAFYGARGNVAEEKKYDEMAINARPSQKRPSQSKN